MALFDQLREARLRIRQHPIARGYRYLMWGVLLWVLVVGGIGWLAIAAYDIWDLHAHYQRVPARIVAVDEQCEVRSYPGSRRSPRYSALMGCAEADAAAAGIPRDQDPAVLHVRRITYDYVSPADGQHHEGRMIPRQWERSLGVGAEIQIHAHLTDPGQSRP